MATWIGRQLPQAEVLIKKGGVKELLFSGSTYQIEIFDEENFWPFLQFDKEGKIKDAFCSCEKAEECVHLAAAYIKITEKEGIPLHVRFYSSLWNQLFSLFADHFGYENSKFKEHEGLFAMQDDLCLFLKTTEPQMAHHLSTMLFSRAKETPENSIKFSDLPEVEIEKWSEGRPSNSLRYTLSVWCDLAKWLFLLLEDNPYTITFEEDEEGLPTSFILRLQNLEVKITYRKQELLKIIPYLRTVTSPLNVSEESLGEIEKISFDEAERCFAIQHKKVVQAIESSSQKLDGWIYQSKVGFTSKKGGSFFDRKVIPSAEIATALTQYGSFLSKDFTLKNEPSPMRYKIFFDAQWNLHFQGYLFKEGDIRDIFGNWVYLGNGVFHAVTDLLFESSQKVITPEQISHFINHHRIWLNGQEGFQTHLANVESHLNYRVDEKRLYFYSKIDELVDSQSSKDFGDWIYYKGQGFFSKAHVKRDQIIRPGLEISLNKISPFIKLNSEELEQLHGFFSPLQPLTSRGIELSILEDMRLLLTPVYTAEDKQVQFFGDFSYVEGEGFSLIPPHMRLPEAFQHEQIIAEKGVSSFLTHDFKTIEKFVIKLDTRLRIPQSVKVVIDYLAKNPKGGIKTRLLLTTEYGQISLTDLLQALQKKKSYLFTDAGLIDLKEGGFEWIRQLSIPFDATSGVLEMSTIDFIKLDATVDLTLQTTDSTQTAITQRILKELREFSVIEKPNIKAMKCELRRYQQTGLSWLWFLYRNGLSALLCDDMGLGKTHQAMGLMAAAMAHKENIRFLVVCPTSVIYHWQDKLEIFLPSVNVHTFHGLKRDAKFPKEGIILTTYGTLRVEKERFKNNEFELAIFDEIQVAKNAQSQLHNALKAVKATMRIGLTGTPIENNLSELKALMDIILPGYMPPAQRFRTQFINPIENEGNEEKKRLLSRLIRPFILRRKKSEVLQELPEKCEDKALCDLSEEQIQLYKETLKSGTKSVLSDLANSTTPIPYIHIFSLLSRLKQICNHPALVAKDPDNFEKYASGKWDLFVELLNEATESEQKVVVFSQYLYMLDIIESYLKKQNIGYAQIRGSTVDRKAELQRFQQDPSCVVFIGSLQAAGLGIDLTAASVVILYDRWWNAARENQAIDRVHRIGQKWKVHVFKLISKKTIEEKIDLMIQKKGALLEEIVTADDQALLKKLSREELIELLNYS